MDCLFNQSEWITLKSGKKVRFTRNSDVENFDGGLATNETIQELIDFKRKPLSKQIHGKTYPQLIESNLEDLEQKVKDLKENNRNMSAILDIQTYAKSIKHWASELEKEIN